MPYFRSADILLPKEEYRTPAWPVVACDQYTSQMEYWNKVNEKVKDQKSTLHLIYPEIYLGSEENSQERIEAIHQTMQQYLDEGVFEPPYKDSFLLVERETSSGKRVGLVGNVDLEAYDFHPEKKAPIRATEETVPERIPPRLKVRDQAPLESPHAMLLIDDPDKRIIETLYEKRDEFPLVYDMDLMMDGGHIRGWIIQNGQAEDLQYLINKFEKDADGFFSVVGDGNHSLATAKAYWEQLKNTLEPEKLKNHPARYALAEIVNLHSPAIYFEPIYRLVLFTQMEDLVKKFNTWLTAQSMDMEEGDDIIFYQNGKMIACSIRNTNDHLPLELLQKFLDEYINLNPQISIDYIHGKKDLEEIVEKTGGIGILLKPIEKSSLFSAVEAGGVLPRKTFSIGEASEKRYYMECRKIG